MMNTVRKAYALTLIVAMCGTVSIAAQQDNCAACHSDVKPEQLARMKKQLAAGERGLGIMDKGQVSNYLGNYDILSSFHEYFNNAIHWPAAGSTSIQYSFGLGLVVSVKGNVITSVVGGPSEKVDWSAKAGSRGKLFSGEVTAPPPDETPFLASSDNQDTWPAG